MKRTPKPRKLNKLAQEYVEDHSKADLYRATILVPETGREARVWLDRRVDGRLCLVGLKIAKLGKRLCPERPRCSHSRVTRFLACIEHPVQIDGKRYYVERSAVERRSVLYFKPDFKPGF